MDLDKLLNLSYLELAFYRESAIFQEEKRLKIEELKIKAMGGGK